VDSGSIWGSPLPVSLGRGPDPLAEAVGRQAAGFLQFHRFRDSAALWCGSRSGNGSSMGVTPWVGPIEGPVTGTGIHPSLAM